MDESAVGLTSLNTVQVRITDGVGWSVHTHAPRVSIGAADRLLMTEIAFRLSFCLPN